MDNRFFNLIIYLEVNVN